MVVGHHSPEEYPPGGTLVRCDCWEGADWDIIDLSVEVADDFVVVIGGEFVFVPSKIDDAFLPLSFFTGSGSPAPKILVWPPPGGLNTLLEGREESPKPMLKLVEVILLNLSENNGN